MSLSEELQYAIEKNLPGLVGTELKKVLSRAAEDAESIPIMQRTIDSQQRQITLLQDWERRGEEVTKREQETTRREIAAATKEALLGVQDTYMKERLADMRGIVKEVFSNNRFKYMESGSQHVVVPQGGYSNQQTINRSVEGEV